MTKTMAEVLAEHILLSHERSGTYACSDPDCGWEFRYQLRMSDLKSGVDVVLTDFAAHQAAALSAAGFGLVADAGAKALEDAADDYRHYETPNARLYLRARAAAVRGEG